MRTTANESRASAPAPRAARGSVAAARLLVRENPAVVTAWCALVLVVLAAGGTFYAARAYLLPIVAAFVLSVLLAPAAGALERRRVPRALAAAAGVFAVCALVYVLIVLVAEPASTWVASSDSILDSVRSHLERFRGTFQTVEELSSEVEELTGRANENEVVLEGPRLTDALAASARRVTIQALFALVLTYFFLLTRDEIRQKAIAAQRSLRGRLNVARMFRDVEKGVAVYITTLAIVNVGLGAAVALGMWALGLPSPIMWGGIAAVLNFVPYVGPALTTILLAAAGLATFDTLLGAAGPAAVYVGLNFVESNFVTPLVLGKRMTINPLAIVLAVSFWTWIWGPVGGLLSIPLLIMLKVICDRTEALRPLGAFIGGPLTRGAVGSRLLRRGRPLAARAARPAIDER